MSRKSCARKTAKVTLIAAVSCALGIAATKIAVADRSPVAAKPPDR